MRWYILIGDVSYLLLSSVLIAGLGHKAVPVWDWRTGQGGGAGQQFKLVEKPVLFCVCRGPVQGQAIT